MIKSKLKKRNNKKNSLKVKVFRNRRKNIQVINFNKNFNAIELYKTQFEYSHYFMLQLFRGLLHYKYLTSRLLKPKYKGRRDDLQNNVYYKTHVLQFYFYFSLISNQKVFIFLKKLFKPDPKLKTANILLNYVMFLQTYLSKLIGYNCLIKVYNFKNLLSPSFLNRMHRIYSRKVPRQLKFIYIHEIIEFFFISIYTKNLGMLARWIKKNIELRPYKQHRLIYFFIQRLLFSMIWRSRKFLKIKGLFFQIQGKLIKGGTMSITKKKKKGLKSFTNKMLRMSSIKFNIRTISGIVGCSIQLFY